MANEHSIRVTARGEFGQLERGLKTLQRDLKDVLGEIDRGARKGGIFDESQLRALDLYKGRFKESLGELDKEFKKQNDSIDQLHRKLSSASQDEQDNIRKQIQLREKELDVIRRKISEMERLHDRALRESSTYTVNPTPSAPQIPGGSGGGGGGGGGGLSMLGGLAKGIGSKLKGVGMLGLGLAGAGGITSVLAEAYQRAFAREVDTLDLAQRLRGANGYTGWNTNIYDKVSDAGRADKLGYQGMETWSFMNTYSQRAGGIDTAQLTNLLKFARGYGLDSQTTADTVGTAKQLGGVTSPVMFAKMIAASVSQSGMTPRVLEVMNTSNQLLRELKTTFKDTGTKQVLAYQTVLDTIGTQKGMTGLTGQNGANVIGGLGGIFNPNDNNPWKWMGLQALKSYNPKKYGKMGLYDLETNFEDGLMNPDNLPAMASYLRKESGGDETLMKRMLQKWLQQGGFNATKRQVNELFDATNGFRSFDKVNVNSVQDMLTSGSATAKYESERKPEYGQTIQDVDAKYTKALEGLGQPILHAVTDLKEGLTDVVNAINESGALDKTYDFLSEHWKELIEALGAIALARMIGGAIPKRGPKGGKGKGKGKGGSEEEEKDKKKGKGGSEEDEKDKKKPTSEDEHSKKKNPPEEEDKPKTREERNKEKKTKGKGKWGGVGEEVEDVAKAGKGRWIKGIAEHLGVAGLIADIGFSVYDANHDKTTAKDVGMTEDPAYTDKLLDHYASNLTFGMWKHPAYDTAKFLNPALSTDKDAWEKSLWGRIGQGFDMLSKALGYKKGEDKGMSGDFASMYIKTHPNLSDKEKGEIEKSVKTAAGKLTMLGNDGLLKISNLSEAGSVQLQEMARKGEISFKDMNTSTSTQVSNLSATGIARLQELEDKGLINIASLNKDGTGNIVALNDKGQEALKTLQDSGLLTLSDFRATSVAQFTDLNVIGRDKLDKLQQEGVIHIDKLRQDGTGQITILNQKGLEALDKMQSEGDVTLTGFAVTGTKQITALNDKGSSELLKLRDKGALSLDGMNSTTDTKLTQINRTHSTELSTMKTEHGKKMEEMKTNQDSWWSKIWKRVSDFFDTDWGKSWKQFVDGVTSGWDKFIEEIKKHIPSWLGGTGDSNWDGSSPYGIVGGGKPVEGSVLRYKDELAAAGKKYGVNDVNLLMAMMQQESGGRGGDPMQSSEGIGLPPNSIKDPLKSIDAGVKEFAARLKDANGDVKTALQSYNFGRGYIDYINKHGGKHTHDLAVQFSQMMARKMGWSSYGDPNYVDHVLQYYPKLAQQVQNANYFNNWQSRVTSHYGDTDGREAPHSGLDIDGNQGDALQALMKAKIVGIKMDDGGKYDTDGRANTTSGGTEMMFQLADGSYYSYSHMSKVDPQLLKKWFEEGQRNIAVAAGQYVGNVGGDPGKPGSGNSTTGSHLHLGRRDKNGNRVDPEPWLRSISSGIGDSDWDGTTTSSTDRGDNLPTFEFPKTIDSLTVTSLHLEKLPTFELPKTVDSMQVASMVVASFGIQREHTQEDEKDTRHKNPIQRIEEMLRLYLTRMRQYDAAEVPEITDSPSRVSAAEAPTQTSNVQKEGTGNADEPTAFHVKHMMHQLRGYLHGAHKLHATSDRIDSGLFPALHAFSTGTDEDGGLFSIKSILHQLQDYIKHARQFMWSFGHEEPDVTDSVTDASTLPELPPFEVKGADSKDNGEKKRVMQQLHHYMADANKMSEAIKTHRSHTEVPPIDNSVVSFLTSSHVETSHSHTDSEHYAASHARILPFPKAYAPQDVSPTRKPMQIPAPEQNERARTSSISQSPALQDVLQSIEAYVKRWESSAQYAATPASVIPFPLYAQQGIPHVDNRSSSVVHNQNAGAHTQEQTSETFIWNGDGKLRTTFFQQMKTIVESLYTYIQSVGTHVAKSSEVPDLLEEQPRTNSNEQGALDTEKDVIPFPTRKKYGVSVQSADTYKDANMIQLMQRYVEREYKKARQPFDSIDPALLDNPIQQPIKERSTQNAERASASTTTISGELTLHINIEGDGARYFSEQQLHIIREEARRMMDQAKYLMMQTNPTVRRM